VVSTRTITAFDPIIISVRNEDGVVGWGEALIAPGYTSETIEGAWQFARDIAAAIVGRSSEHARWSIMARLSESPGAASAILTALDMQEAHRVLFPKHDIRVPLLAPLQAHTAEGIRDDVDRLVNEG